MKWCTEGGMRVFKYKMVGVKALKRNLTAMRGATGMASRIAMERACEDVRSYMVRTKLRKGTPLCVGRKGRLWKSYQTTVHGFGLTITGFIGTNLKYAAIHEFGGTIRATKAPYLWFPIRPRCSKSDKIIRWVRTKEVTMPKRAHLEPALREREKVTMQILGGTFFKQVTMKGIVIR